MGAATCKTHPDRKAIGICVRCRSRVCAECVTKVDGINYCVVCLSALAEEGGARRRREARPPSAAMAVFAAAAFFAVLTLMTWVLLEVVLPGGASALSTGGG